MHRDPKQTARNSSKTGDRSVLISYDSGVEHSWEHWAEVQKLVEKEDDEEGVSAKHLIQQRAYELYEHRGKEDGYDLDDWLQAEAEITQTARGAAA
jgi:hypothetical protein